MLSDIDESEEQEKNGETLTQDEVESKTKRMAEVVWTKKAFDQFERAIKYINKEQGDTITQTLFEIRFFNPTSFSKTIQTLEQLNLY